MARGKLDSVSGAADQEDLDRLVRDQVQAAISPVLEELASLSAALRSLAVRQNPSPAAAPAASAEVKALSDGIALLLEVESKREAREAARASQADPVRAMVDQVSSLSGLMDTLGYQKGPGLVELGIELIKVGGPMVDRFSRLVEVRSRGEELRNRRFADKYKIEAADLYDQEDEGDEGKVDA